MALEAGSLRVTLQYAKDLKDQDWFGKQDPYVKLRLGSYERRSRTCRDGGRNPVWEETFEFGIINENTLELTLFDEDTLVRDDLIGTANVSLARAREQGIETIQAPVYTKRRQAKGFVQLTLTFTPNSRLRPGTAQQQQQQPYGQAPYGQAPYGQAPYGAAPAYGYAAPYAAPYQQQQAYCQHPAPAYQPAYAASYHHPPPATAPPAYQPAYAASYHYAPAAPSAPPPYGYGAPAAPPQAPAPAYGYYGAPAYAAAPAYPAAYRS